MGPLGWRGRVSARGRGANEHHPEDGFQGGNPLASRPHNRFEGAASHETKPLFNTFCLSSLPSLCTPNASSSAPLPQPAEPFTALELLQLLEQRFRSDQARGQRRLETSSWEVPRLPEPKPPAAGSAPAAGSGGGSPWPDWPAAGRTTDTARLILSSL